MVPIITWNPWNPVPKKKHDPKAPSDKVNEETSYSIPWNKVNTSASITVNAAPNSPLLLRPCIKEWWQYVIVTPDASNIAVFSRGNSKAFIASIPTGGHWPPNSTVGDRALWKYAQNIARKNNTSDTINKATPMFKPLWTAKVWLPI